MIEAERRSIVPNLASSSTKTNLSEQTDALSPEQKFEAKRANEGIKLLATYLNNLAIGALITGFLSALLSGRNLPVVEDDVLIGASVALHIAGRIVLSIYYKPEE